MLGYFSWGSNDPANQLRQMGLTFEPGAIGGMFVSTDGRTFREPSPNWKPAPAGSATGGQSLVGDLIREGITGVSGTSRSRTSTLSSGRRSSFRRISRASISPNRSTWRCPISAGRTSSSATRFVLPVPVSPVGPIGPAGPWVLWVIDPDDGAAGDFLPNARSRWRSNSPLNSEALKLNLKALSLRAQGKPEPRSEAVFERATALEPTRAQSQLALCAEGAQATTTRPSRAIGRCWRPTPNNVVALNNLAYALADKKNQLAEALPLAERAYRLSDQAPLHCRHAGLDTLQAGRLRRGQAPA